MAFKIAYTDQSILPRSPRKHDKPHLEFIRRLPCVICMKPGVDAAHIRYSDDRYLKRQTGMGERPSDKWTVPLCREHHTIQHSVNEGVFWRRYGIDPCALALMLHSVSPEIPAGERVVRNWNGWVKSP